MRHMVAVRQSHSRGPYRKWLSQRQQAHAWRRKTATAAHRHGHKAYALLFHATLLA